MKIKLFIYLSFLGMTGAHTSRTSAALPSSSYYFDDEESHPKTSHEKLQSCLLRPLYGEKAYSTPYSVISQAIWYIPGSSLLARLSKSTAAAALDATTQGSFKRFARTLTRTISQQALALAVQQAYINIYGPLNDQAKLYCWALSAGPVWALGHTHEQVFDNIFGQ